MIICGNFKIGIIFLAALLISSESRFVNKVIYCIFLYSTQFFTKAHQLLELFVYRWGEQNSFSLSLLGLILNLWIVFKFQRVLLPHNCQRIKNEVRWISFAFHLQSNEVTLLCFFFITIYMCPQTREPESADLVSKKNAVSGMQLSSR